MRECMREDGKLKRRFDSRGRIIGKQHIHKYLHAVLQGGMDACMHLIKKGYLGAGGTIVD